MTPKLVYLAAVGLATLQTTQAFLVPPSLTFPELRKSGSDGKAAHHDQVNALPILDGEDMREKMKNLQLGVSKPFPFSIHSGDAQEASDKAKHYFRKACKKFKGHMHEFENDAENFGKKFMNHIHEAQDDVQEEVPNLVNKLKSHVKGFQKDVPKFADKAEEELEELDRKILDWWKHSVPSTKEVQDDVEGFVSEIESEIQGIDWSQFDPTAIKGHTVENKPIEELGTPSQLPEGVQRFSISFSYPDEDGDDDDDDSDGLYVELVNMETGEITRERIDLDLDFDMDFEEYEDEDEDNPYSVVEESFAIPHHFPSDTVTTTEWHGGRMRCMASRFRRAMRSVASALRAFITGFLIPVLIGVAAGMAASLFGMLVGTLCGWLWVKLFRGGRRTDNEAEFIEYRPAGDGLGEKDTLLVVESVASDEDAPPVYVEKE